MTKHRNDLAKGSPLPATWLAAIQEYISTIASNLVVTKLSANQVRVAAGTGNAQVAVGIQGRWRWNTANADATHPTGGAGTYDVFVTANENDFTAPEPADATNYSFGLVVLPSGSTPTGTGAQAIFRKVATTTWDGSQITAIANLLTPPPSGPAGGDLAGSYPDPVVSRASSNFVVLGGGLELGNSANNAPANTPFADFHFSPGGTFTGQDFNVRAINNADGALQIISRKLAYNFDAPLLTLVPPEVNASTYNGKIGGPNVPVPAYSLDMGPSNIQDVYVRAGVALFGSPSTFSGLQDSVLIGHTASGAAMSSSAARFGFRLTNLGSTSVKSYAAQDFYVLVSDSGDNSAIAMQARRASAVTVLGFFGATPVARPTGYGSGSQVTAGTKGALSAASTLNDVITNFSSLVADLRALGLIGA